MKGKGKTTSIAKHPIKEGHRGIESGINEKLDEAFRSIRLAMFELVEKSGFKEADNFLRELDTCNAYLYGPIEEPTLQHSASKVFLKRMKEIVQSHESSINDEEDQEIFLSTKRQRFNRLRDNLSSQVALTKSLLLAMKNNQQFFRETLRKIGARLHMLTSEQRESLIGWMDKRLRNMVDYQTSHPRIILDEIWTELNKQYKKSKNKISEQLTQGMEESFDQSTEEDEKLDQPIQSTNENNSQKAEPKTEVVNQIAQKKATKVVHVTVKRGQGVVVQKVAPANVTQKQVIKPDQSSQNKNEKVEQSAKKKEEKTDQVIPKKEEDIVRSVQSRYESIEQLIRYNDGDVRQPVQNQTDEAEQAAETKDEKAEQAAETKGEKAEQAAETKDEKAEQAAETKDEKAEQAAVKKGEKAEQAAVKKEENFDKLIQDLHMVFFERKSGNDLADHPVERLSELPLLKDVATYQKPYLQTIQSLMYKDMNYIRWAHIKVSTGISIKTLQKLFESDLGLFNNLLSHLEEAGAMIKVIKNHISYRRFEKENPFADMPNALISILVRDIIKMNVRGYSPLIIYKKINYFIQLLAHQKNAQTLDNALAKGLSELEPFDARIREVFLEHAQALLKLAENSGCQLENIMTELKEIPADVATTILKNNAFIAGLNKESAQENWKLLSALKTFEPNVVRCFFADNQTEEGVNIQRSLTALFGKDKKPEHKPLQSSSLSHNEKSSLPAIECLIWLQSMQAQLPKLFECIDQRCLDRFNEWDPSWANGLVVALSTLAANVSQVDAATLTNNVRKLRDSCELNNAQERIKVLFKSVKGLSIYHLLSLETNQLDLLIRSAIPHHSNIQTNSSKQQNPMPQAVDMLSLQIEEILKPKVESLSSSIQGNLVSKPNFDSIKTSKMTLKTPSTYAKDILRKAQQKELGTERPDINALKKYLQRNQEKYNSTNKLPPVSFPAGSQTARPQTDSNNSLVKPNRENEGKSSSKQRGASQHRIEGGSNTSFQANKSTRGVNQSVNYPAGSFFKPQTYRTGGEPDAALNSGRKRTGSIDQSAVLKSGRRTESMDQSVNKPQNNSYKK